MIAGLDWHAANKAYLVRALERVRSYLVARVEADGAIETDVERPADVPTEDHGGREFALSTLVGLFGLSPFERDVVLLCAGAQLDWRFGPLIGAAHGDAARDAPTFGLALTVIPDAHWSALTPGAPLRSWHLVELEGQGVANAPLRIDERVLHFLAGVNQLDQRLAGMVSTDGIDPGATTPTQEVVAERVVATLAAAVHPTAVQLVGADRDTRLAIAARAAVRRGSAVLRIQAHDVPGMASDRYALARLVSREALLDRGIVLVECEQAEAADVSAFVDSLMAPSILSAAEPLGPLGSGVPMVEVPAPSPTERLAGWDAALGGDLGARLNGSLGPLAAQFVLSPSSLRAVAARTAAVATHGSPAEVEQAVWDACRIEARPRLDGLAQRIEAVAAWDDLVLPEGQVQTLHAIASQVRQRHRVYDQWGFAGKGARSLGISSLFAGPSGTGKTMAAEVLARELALDLYRIDLATVVSKYIGETEKNLKRLFDAAEAGGAILLFDEADALFGKRSDVKDSHDRYANIEVSYLLQRMESYRGLAILTTNLKTALDVAFLRRIRFIVHFPFPDAEQRARIWRGIFPKPTPTTMLDYDLLSQLDVAGGHIRNIALNGAFLAADRSQSVTMAHLAEAAQSEYAKLERPISDAEFRGWS